MRASKMWGNWAILLVTPLVALAEEEKPKTLPEARRQPWGRVSDV
jgi:hypothetical protein